LTETQIRIIIKEAYAVTAGQAEFGETRDQLGHLLRTTCGLGCQKCDGHEGCQKIWITKVIIMKQHEIRSSGSLNAKISIMPVPILARCLKQFDSIVWGFFNNVSGMEGRSLI